MRRVAALVRKDVREHRVSAGIALALLTTFQLCVAGWAEQQGDPSLFSAVAGTMDLTVPIGALLLGHFLVVRELEGRTRALLAALPLPAWLLWAEKLTLGAVLILALVAWQLTVATLLAGHVELLPFGWALRIGARYAAFGLTWWVTAAVVGLGGRLRAVAWCLLMVGLYATEEVAGEGWTPLALVEAPLSADRWGLRPGPFGIAAVFSLGCLAIAGVLLAWRGGRLVERLQAGRSGAAGFAILPAALLLSALLPDSAPEPAWAALPGGTIRAASPALEGLAARAVAVLPALEARLGAPLPDVILVDGALADADRAEVLDTPGGEVVVAVPEATPAPVATLLSLALDAHFPAAALRADGWRVAGLPAAVARPEEAPLLRACAALATSDTVADWPTLRARWGVAIAGALAGERLRASAAAPLAPALLAPKATVGALLRGPPAAPEDWAAWRPDLPAPTLPALTWKRQGGMVTLWIDAPVEGALSLTDAHVEWAELPERQRWPVEPDREPLPPDPGSGTWELPLPASPTATLAVRLVVPLPGCDLPSPWVTLP